MFGDVVIVVGGLVGILLVFCSWWDWIDEILWFVWFYLVIGKVGWIEMGDLWGRFVFGDDGDLWLYVEGGWFGDFVWEF